MEGQARPFVEPCASPLGPETSVGQGVEGHARAPTNAAQGVVLLLRRKPGLQLGREVVPHDVPFTAQREEHDHQHGKNQRHLYEM